MHKAYLALLGPQSLGLQTPSPLFQNVPGAFQGLPEVCTKGRVHGSLILARVVAQLRINILCRKGLDACGRFLCFILWGDRHATASLDCCHQRAVIDTLYCFNHGMLTVAWCLCLMLLQEKGVDGWRKLGCTLKGPITVQACTINGTVRKLLICKSYRFLWLPTASNP